MTEDRRSAGWLDAELARREHAEVRIAASLVELESHPGHQLLTGVIPTGRTGERWASAQLASAGMWEDLETYRDVVRAAREVRERRSRPGERELAELHRLLVLRSVEVARSPVALADRGLTGVAERVETVTLPELANRMEVAFAEVSGLVVTCHEAHSAFLSALVPPTQRLRHARALVAELEMEPSDPGARTVAALTTRVADLDRAAASDPLSFAAGPPSDRLAALDAEITTVVQRLTKHAAVRHGWEPALAEMTAAVTGIAVLRDHAASTRLRAVELVAGSVPALPPDRLPALRAALARLTALPGWAARTAALESLRHATDSAATELRAAHELSAGLLERRDELRGRFGAYRAKAARLGRAEDPRLLTLDERIQGLLWTRPSDLAAATRELASYRQLVSGGSP